MPPVRRPSGSKVGRALACAASCWLPEGPPQPVHPSAPKGTRIHAAIERSFLTSREPDIYHGLRADEVELARKAIVRRPYVAPAYAHWPMVEVEVWYNPLTCESVFGSTPDDPPHGWWRGRADAIGRAQDETLGPADWKTGSPRHQTPPGKSAQLFYFSAALASHPDSRDEVARTGTRHLVYTTQDGGIHISYESPARIKAMQEEMAALEAKLQVVEQGGPEAERVMAENPPVKNKECFYCPCRPLCPVWKKDQE